MMKLIKVFLMTAFLLALSGSITGCGKNPDKPKDKTEIIPKTEETQEADNSTDLEEESLESEEPAEETDSESDE
ncbi:hypothetical protein ACFL5V_06935 [Fibrobacterota bacterium]